MDFIATFAELAGADLANGSVIDGVNIMPILEREETTRPPIHFWYKDFQHYSIDGNYRIHRMNGEDVYEDYTLSMILDDTIGTAQRVDDPGNVIRNRLVDNLRAWRGDCGTPGTVTGPRTIPYPRHR